MLPLLFIEIGSYLTDREQKNKLARFFLLDDTFRMSSPFTDTAVNELRNSAERAPLIHDCLFQLLHSLNIHRNTLAAAGLSTQHNLPGSSMDCLLAKSQAR